MIEKIERFIGEHHLLSLATKGERLWCCSMFYAYDPKTVSFIVASDETTEHMKNMAQNHHVAGTVALETKTVGKIQGIQFVGEIEKCSDGLETIYFKAFPYARIMNPTLWIIRLDEVKMTDNTLGFGKKVTWKREF
ncbi:pyridoxamine 5'-phosphate oxidase family protein [Sulfuricurvum sp.]|uniref:pyridoxamine 5'-phosphate oxidase family protein n=1 Tax=Sulfuricurvum sp. TaxID=2025608 RepID=UPI003BB6DCD3